ncbi:MAG: CBS domain-containing protein, partial [Crenarchaeota archaeon]|nr:CBS domain-containing protein [Thermoproteota archaeon]
DYLQSSCRTCMDFTAELSDISVGAAYPLENWSMVIIRTKTGEEFFNKAAADGAIVVKPIETEPAVYENLVIASMKKRATALEAAESIEKAYGYLPVLLLRESGALANVKVEDVMVKNIETVPYDMTVGQLLHLMTQKHHIAYPVIGEKGEPLGFITIEDASQISKDEREEILVSQIIHRKPISVHIGETGIDAFKKMSENEVGRVLVVDPADSQKIIGLITKTDLMHGLINQR